ncbi:MAG: hypothetical protein JWR54_4034 [Mucilaginibacter sp.]|nr:hypothetical protein [Mucilaginibacter sp.]
MDSPGIKQLLIIIEQQLDWGDASSWQSKDFELLNQLIFEKTKVSLSASTLRRIWGRVEYNHLPSGTTLDTLARFAGFESWRAFNRQNPASEKAIENPIVKPKEKSRWRLKIAVVILVVVTIALVSMYAKKTPAPIKGPYVFNTRPITRTIPNSVVFTYDVKTNPGDSVFIQQSWDPDTRVPVDKNKHQFTSVYYGPGFYHAKLLVNNKIVKERLLMIPTTGWLGAIEHHPVPVYLHPKEFISKDGLHIPKSVISRNNIPLGPQPPAVGYYNVGNFDPVPLKDFSFSAQIRNDYHDGAAACQYSQIILITDNTPVIIQLSAKGCISNLSLSNGGYYESGKNNDLSGFGADMSQWVKVSCHSVANKIQYFVNDKLVYQSILPLYNENIVGMGYGFQGTGSVKNIELKTGNKLVFKAF